jgi:hypothetical protein
MLRTLSSRKLSHEKTEMILSESPFNRSVNKSKDLERSPRSKQMHSDEFDPDSSANIELANKGTMATQTGMAGYLYLMRQIRSFVKNTFNFRIVDSKSMDIHIGVELSEKYN